MSEIVLASNALASRLGVEKTHMLATIKGQCFPNMHPDNVSDTMLAAFVQVAQSLNLNPLLPGMVYAYPAKNGGITPIIGPDGIFQLLTNNPDIEGWSVKHEEIDGEKAATAIIKHKRLGDIAKTVFLSEWKVPNNPNWSARPRHMLEIRALKQAARQIVHGIPFDEEERKIAEEVNVTPEPETPAAPERPKVSRRGGAAAAASEPTVTAPAQEVKPAPAKKDAPPIIDADTGEPEPSAEDMAKAEKEAAANAAKAEREATEKALKEREAKEKAKADAKADASKPTEPAAVDTSKVPEVIPGVGINSFLGKSYPVTLTGTIKTITTGAQGATLYAKAMLDTPQGEFEVAIFNTAGKTDNLLKKEDSTIAVNNPALRVDALIEFDLTAKLRGSKDKDPATGKPLPDLTRAPALIASNIKDADDSSQFPV
jgi:hypothetical protein